MITTMFGAGYSSAQTPTQPWHLVFSTYLGGKTACDSRVDPLTFAQNAACDTQGNTYVTGGTQVSDLPGTNNAFQQAPAADSTMSAFVAKYDPAGHLLWCTYLGGNQQSLGVGVAAMPDGGVAVAGLTSSDASGPFPVKNAFQEQNHGQSDYFVTVLDANGNLQYSTYMGGSEIEGDPADPFADDSNNGNNIAVDAAGLVYVAGTTESGSEATKPFHTTDNANQKVSGGGADAFLCIFDPTKSGTDSLIYSSFLGGKGHDKGHSVAVDPNGTYITVAGFTTSSNFPIPETVNSYRRQAPSSFTSNGFVTQFLSTKPGSPSSVYAMVYSTYLGGVKNNPRDDTYGIALDPTGLIVATGRTQSSDFPMTVGGPTIFNSAPYLQSGVSNDEPYVVKIDPYLYGTASLVYSTFLGGGAQNGGWGGFCTSVGVDARGAVFAAGESNAPGQVYDPSNRSAPQTFPYTPNALFTSRQGNFDAIFMQIDPGGEALDYSTYLGGTGNDRTYGLAVDPSGNVILSGLTFSKDFPLKNAAQIYPKNGYQNAFVTKFSPSIAPIGSFLLLLMAD